MSMEKITSVSAEAKSPDLIAENIAKLKSLFPELVTEGPEGLSVNVDVLKQLVGDHTVTDCDEKYGLNWFGKRRARQLALTPSTGTLRPAPEESENWDTTQNIFIEGDNLEVLKLLQKSYAGKVKLIYIDPPYNTGKDFVYKDDYRDNIKNYKRLTGQVDEEGSPLTTNTETSGRFHTDWLNMMYPRLKVARNLLREDGVIFISTDDNEVAHLRKLCDEFFGEENFVEKLVWLNKEGGGGSDSKYFRRKHEYLLTYARSKAQLAINGVEISNLNRYTMKDEHYSIRGPYYLQKLAQSSIQYSESLDYPIEAPDGSQIFPGETNGKKNCYRWSKSKVEWGIREGFVEFRKDRSGNWQIYTKQYLKCDNEGNQIDRTNRPLAVIENFSTTQASKYLKQLFNAEIFKYSKPYQLISFLLQVSCTKDDIILDFFAGSCTTAHAVLDLNKEDGGNRKFIMVQLPEPCDEKSEAFKAGYKTIADIGKERIRRAAKKIKEEHPDWDGDTGFRVFKLDSSNIKAWNPRTDDLEADLVEQMEHILPDRTESDLLYELLLKLGLDLCVPIEQKEIAGKTVHAIGGGVLMACLAEKITTEETEALGLGIVEWHKNLAPAGDTTCVFRDSTFTNDVAKTNLAAILEQAGIANVRSL